MIDMLANEPQFVDHLALIYLALPPEHRGDFITHRSVGDRARAWGIEPRRVSDHIERPVLVASYGDQKRARRLGRKHIARAEHGAGQCLAPETRVLTADYRYIPVGSLVVGDRLVAFEESPSDRPLRGWRTSTVTAVQEIRRPSYRMYLADGTSFVASAEHLWLCRDRQSYEWTRTENLQDAARWPTRSSKLIKAFDTWETDDSWGGGYLAAAFDGEGCLTQTTRIGRQNRMMLSLAQKDNGLLATVRHELAARQFRFSVSRSNTKTGVVHVAVLGGTRGIARFVGSIRPRRLLDNLKPLDNGQMRGEPIELLASEPIGEQTMIGLETSTGTLIAEGFATHNSYFGDMKFGGNASYAGGRDCHDVSLFLCPNDYSANRWQDSYPGATVEVVGCAKLDSLPAREAGPGPVVAFSMHFDINIIPETRWAWPAYRSFLPELAKRFTVIGHAHPKVNTWPGLHQHFRRLDIEFVPDFADVCRRADLYVVDNSSTLFEFAAIGRPVVPLNIPEYRRNVNHGGRFWDWADVGLQVDDPRRLADTVHQALTADTTAQREAVLSQVYPYRTGGAQRAAAALLDWIGATAEVAA